MFYASIWDPALILAQILVLQCLFYHTVAVWLILGAIFFGSEISLAALLAPTEMEMFQSSGWPAISAFLLVAPVLGYFLLLVVGRAKQCLDFTGTLYGIHFCICSLYQGGIPWNWEWWAVNSIGCIVSVVLGEYLCLQKELEAIPMTSDEREARERRAANQHALNVAAERQAHATERDSLIEEEQSLRGERGLGGVTTTTIRLTPGNFNNV